MAIGVKIVDGDFLIQNRKLIFVQDNEKLLKDFRKFLLTEAETTNNATTYYRYNPKYGTLINDKSLYMNLSNDSTIDLINQNLGKSIKYYIALQEARSNLSLGEIISNVEFMTFADPYDARVIKISMKIITPKNNTINVGTFTQTTA